MGLLDESSAFWDGTTVGDAAGDQFNAPYSATEFGNILGLLFSSYVNAFVIPGVGGLHDGSQLRVQASSPAAMTVDVVQGYAFVNDRMYSTGSSIRVLTIAAADATNPRLDRVVIRIDYTAKTARLAVLTGTPAGTPSLPALASSATLVEFALAYIWVAALSSSVLDLNIHDERLFAQTSEGLRVSQQSTNLAKNSEFMAHSSLILSTTPALAPDLWDTIGTATFERQPFRPDQMARGRAIIIVAGASNSGKAQTVPVKPSTIYSIKTITKVTAGDVGVISVTTDSASPGTITRQMRRTGAWIEETIYYGTESDATTLTLSLLAASSGDIVEVGQSLIIEGYYPGPFRPFHEIVAFANPVTDTSWDGDAKSTSTVTINLPISYTGGVIASIILAGTHALLMLLQANDSGSAGNDVYLKVGATGGPYKGVYLSGVVNDRIRQGEVTIPIDSAEEFDIDVLASGGGTLDAYVAITGIYT